MFYALAVEACKDERTGKPNGSYRAIVFALEYVEGQDGPVRSIHNIVESDDASHAIAIACEGLEVPYVLDVDGVCREPEYITVGEAACAIAAVW